MSLDFFMSNPPSLSGRAKGQPHIINYNVVDAGSGEYDRWVADRKREAYARSRRIRETKIYADDQRTMNWLCQNSATSGVVLKSIAMFSNNPDLVDNWWRERHWACSKNPVFLAKGVCDDLHQLAKDSGDKIYYFKPSLFNGSVFGEQTILDKKKTRIRCASAAFKKYAQSFLIQHAELKECNKNIDKQLSRLFRIDDKSLKDHRAKILLDAYHNVCEEGVNLGVASTVLDLDILSGCFSNNIYSSHVAASMTSLYTDLEKRGVTYNNAYPVLCYDKAEKLASDVIHSADDYYMPLYLELFDAVADFDYDLKGRDAINLETKKITLGSIIVGKNILKHQLPLAQELLNIARSID